jgi:lipopolysaccharide export system permease protein
MPFGASQGGDKMLVAIWQRYVFKRFFKLFAFFLASSYSLYVLIDYTTHVQDFLQATRASIVQVGFYYLLQFIKRADILIPVSLLLSAIRTLTSLNDRRELLAFQTAGISRKRLVRPIILFGALCSGLVMTLNEMVLPASLNKINRFYNAHLDHSFRDKHSDTIRLLHFDDHSRLIYQSYDSSKEAFCDVVWIQSPTDIWKMKYLIGGPEHPEGLWVDHLQRGPKGGLQKIHSFKSLIIPELHWNRDTSKKVFIPFENHSITDLWKLWKYDHHLSPTKKNEVLTQLLYKLTFPLLSLIVLIGIAPYALHFSRQQKSTPIYAWGIFSIVAFIAFLDSAVILGENAILSPILGIVSPSTLLMVIFGLKFSRM